MVPAPSAARSTVSEAATPPPLASTFIWLGDVCCVTLATVEPLIGPIPTVAAMASDPCHCAEFPAGRQFCKTVESCSASQTAWGEAANLWVPLISMDSCHPFYSLAVDTHLTLLSEV